MATRLDFSVRDSAVPRDLTSPDLAIRDLAVRDAATPDLAVRDLAAPDFSVRDLAVVDLAVPDLAVRDLATPDLSARDLAQPPGDALTGDLAIPPGGILWTRERGTVAEDKAVGVATDRNGNIFVTGVTAGSLDGNAFGGGNYDTVLLKFDSMGNRLWTYQSSLVAWEVGQAVTTDAAGNAYVCGSTNDLMLVKFDGQGNRLWTRTRGTLMYEYCTGAVTDGAGGVYIVGWTDGGELDGFKNFFRGKDALLLKYDEQGNWLWTVQFGTPNGEVANGVAVDAMGNVFVAGFTDYIMDGRPVPPGFLLNGDFFLVKFDAKGNRLWTRQRGGNGYSDESASRVAVDAAGNVFVAGTMQQNFDGYVSAGNSDVILVKYDNQGNYLWTRHAGTPGWDDVYGLTTDGAGNVYLAGRTQGSLNGGMLSGPQDYFVMKYDGQGKLLWTRQNGTLGFDAAYDITFDRSGYLYLTGTASGSLEGQPYAGGTDLFLTKMSPLP